MYVYYAHAWTQAQWRGVHTKIHWFCTKRVVSICKSDLDLLTSDYTTNRRMQKFFENLDCLNFFLPNAHFAVYPKQKVLFTIIPVCPCISFPPFSAQLIFDLLLPRDLLLCTYHRLTLPSYYTSDSSPKIAPGKSRLSPTAAAYIQLDQPAAAADFK